jgi:hypothetical protein
MTTRPGFVIVYDGANRALGFIMARRKEFEAFTADEVSLGLFKSRLEGRGCDSRDRELTIKKAPHEAGQILNAK